MQKRNSLSLSLILGAFFYSCSTNKDEVQVEKGDTSFVVNDSVLQSPVLTDTSVFEDFRNIEFVDYCLPLPLHGFKEDFSEEQVKGKHVFLDEKNSAYFIEVQGLLRENPLVSLADYFANSYTVEDEEQGKIVLEKKIIPEVNAFYATGYLTI